MGHRALHAEADPREPGRRNPANEASPTESGFASVVISASAASPNSESMRRSTEPSAAGVSNVGVPPAATNTVRTGTSRGPRIRRASVTSAAS